MSEDVIAAPPVRVPLVSDDVGPGGAVGGGQFPVVLATGGR
ncbi:hypothetical protein [Gordonia sp. N1V]|nr:hypothetical protein [Gordonia sp. N1V]MDF3280699.1 hypothetical protein [Gordonia sp. N1V]